MRSIRFSDVAGREVMDDGEPATPPASDSRVGGSDPAPAPGKPAWVWWVAGVFLVMLGAGGFRLWRSMAAVRTPQHLEMEHPTQLD